MTEEDLVVTDRLRLRMWTVTDAPLVRALHADPAVNRYLSPDAEPWSDERVARRMAEWWLEFERDGLTKFKLTRQDGLFLGYAGFTLLQERGEFELGYSILPQHWGQGYATEAAAALARHFIDQDFASHFVAFVHADNAASQRVLEKIGMRLERADLYFGMPARFYRMDKKLSR